MRRWQGSVQLTATTADRQALQEMNAQRAIVSLNSCFLELVAQKPFPRYDAGIKKIATAINCLSHMNNAYTDEDLRRCTLSGRREILFQLRSLIRQSERVSVSFDEGRQSFLTVLIDVLEDEGYLTFDIGGSEVTNRAFLKAERCLFVGVVDGIRIQFSAQQPRKRTINGEEVFAVTLPRSLLRLQRREAFRLQLPSTKPYICRIRRGSAQEVALPLYDISVGGIGIQVSEPLAFEPMEQLENCWIDLRDSGMLAVTLEVRYVMATESRTGKMLFHMGCRFLKLSPLNETQIQRFMAHIEAERRALLAP